MYNKETIKKIFLDEIEKFKIIRYKIMINNLKLTIHSNKLHQSLIDNSYYFHGRSGKEWIFEYYKKYETFYSYDNDFFSKINKNEFEINFEEIFKIMEIILKETFNFKEKTNFIASIKNPLE